MHTGMINQSISHAAVNTGAWCIKTRLTCSTKTESSHPQNYVSQLFFFICPSTHFSSISGSAQFLPQKNRWTSWFLCVPTVTSPWWRWCHSCPFQPDKWALLVLCEGLRPLFWHKTATLTSCKTKISSANIFITSLNFPWIISWWAMKLLTFICECKSHTENNLCA